VRLAPPAVTVRFVWPRCPDLVPQLLVAPELDPLLDVEPLELLLDVDPLELLLDVDPLEPLLDVDPLELLDVSIPLDEPLEPLDVSMPLEDPVRPLELPDPPELPVPLDDPLGLWVPLELPLDDEPPELEESVEEPQAVARVRATTSDALRSVYVMGGFLGGADRRGGTYPKCPRK
jgi:hypothetical protein